MKPKGLLSLNPRLLAATLMMVVFFEGNVSAQKQTTLDVAYDVIPEISPILQGLDVTGDIVIYADFLTVSCALSYTKRGYNAGGDSYSCGGRYLCERPLRRVNVSRTYLGIGPGVRLGLGGWIQMFGHFLFGSLRADVENLDTSSNGERYGGGIDLIGDHSFVRLVRFGAYYDGEAHITIGAGFWF